MAQFDLFRPSKRSWNRGRIVGAKPPLKPKHIWGIRQQLKSSSRVRDLALFNGLDGYRPHSPWGSGRQQLTF